MAELDVTRLSAKLRGYLSRGVRAAELTADGDLVLTLTDGSTLNLGNVTLRWRGAYAAAETYRRNDLVKFTDGNIYLHIGAEDTAGTAPTDTDTWALVIHDAEAARPYSQAAAESAADAAGSASDAEAWAVGKRGGTTVTETDETYENNAKYYAGEAGTSAQAAAVSENAARLFTGAPRTAATAAAMTDTGLIYVYVGSETGYTNGNWYYHNGTSWVSGGIYNSTAYETDTSLTVAGRAADAAATGAGFTNAWKLGRVDSITDKDYNDLTTPGTFRIASANAASSMTNGPTNLAHRLIVQRLAGTASTDCLQIVITNQNGLYWRARTNADGWRAWTHAATERNLQDLENGTIAEILRDISRLVGTAGDSAIYVTLGLETLAENVDETQRNGTLSRKEVDGKLRLIGTPDNSRYLVAFNGGNYSRTSTNTKFTATLPAGRYKAFVSSSGQVTDINKLEVTYSTFQNGFQVADGETVELTADAMVAVRVVANTDYGTSMEETGVHTDITAGMVRLESAAAVESRGNPYAKHALKKPGETNERGFAHQAFPDVCYWDGKLVIASRASASHYTPTDPDEWGGVEVHTVSQAGELRYVKTITKASLAGIEGEVRSCHMLPTKWGLLACGWTTYYDENNNANTHHDKYIALLNNNFNVARYHPDSEPDPEVTVPILTINPVTGGILFTGKPLLTPSGNILLSGYHGYKDESQRNHGNVYICRSSEAFNGRNLDAMTFSSMVLQAGAETDEEPENVDGNECCMGYYQNKLYIIVRNGQSGQASSLYVTEDLEGQTGWRVSKSYTRNEDGIGTVIHMPVLLPKSDGPYLLFAGANYRGSRKRNAIVGYINVNDDTDDRLYTAIIDDDLDYGGYLGITKFEGTEFDVAYYKEGQSTTNPATAINSAVYYKRINTKTMLPYLDLD